MLAVCLWTSHLNSLNLLFVVVLCTLMRLGQRIQLWDPGAEGENFKKTLKLETTFEVNNWKWFSYWKGFKPQLDYSTIYDHTRHWSSMDQPPNPLLSFALGSRPIPDRRKCLSTLAFDMQYRRELGFWIWCSKEPVCLPTSWHSKKAYLYTCMLSVHGLLLREMHIRIRMWKATIPWKCWSQNKKYILGILNKIFFNNLFNKATLE